MHYVTILWSGAAAATLLLAMVHAAIWANDRNARASLALSLIALAVVGIAYTELGMMMSETPDQWARWVRWCHLPLFLFFTGIVWFVQVHFGTGRLWLMWGVIAIRGVILLVNFTVPPNFNFATVTALRPMDFLGDTVSVVAQATPGRWQLLATLSGLMLVAYFLDASLSLWRQNGPVQRRRALLLGGSLLLSASLAILLTQLVIWRVVDLPMLITPPYLIAVAAMAYELGRETIRANRLSASLSEAEGRLTMAADAAQLGLWSWDASQQRVWATDRARTIIGFQPGEAIRPEVVSSHIHEEDLSRVREALRKSIEDRADFCIEFRAGPPGAATSWVCMQGAPEDEASGRIHLMRGVLRDISEQKQVEKEAEELRRAVAHSGRVTMLGQLASSLAHELGQPLGAILRNTEAAQMLFQAPSPNIAELQAIIADIHSDDRRAGDIIDRLRSLLKRGQMQLEPQSVAPLIKDVIALVHADAASRHVELQCHVDEALPLISGDRVHLSQVLVNLILNGMEAASESGQPQRRITISAGRSIDNALDIAVADSGKGIPDGVMSQIFEPFFTTRAGGMGMGLAISRTIIEAHGGQLWAKNAPAGGAVFHIRLPLAQGAA